jgi:hypothetical protein
LLSKLIGNNTHDDEMWIERETTSPVCVIFISLNFYSFSPFSTFTTNTIKVCEHSLTHLSSDVSLDVLNCSNISTIEQNHRCSNHNFTFYLRNNDRVWSQKLFLHFLSFVSWSLFLFFHNNFKVIQSKRISTGESIC